MPADWRSAALCLAVLSLQVPAVEPIDDEALIHDLLTNGRLILSEDVAAVLPVEESSQQIRRVGLAKNGVQIRAAFRDNSLRMATRGRGVGKYHDAYYNEVAAYVVSRYLGLKTIPPTVLRSLPISARGLDDSDELLEGSLQLWIENAPVLYDLEEAGKTLPDDPATRNEQLKEIRFLDCIIGNLDRHQGNLLIDLKPRLPDRERASDRPFTGKLWAIDHTSAFHSGAGIIGKHCRIGRIKTTPVSLVFIQRLRAWQLTEVTEALRASGLSAGQLKKLNLEAMDRRARKVRSHLEKLQQASGLDDKAFYSTGEWHRVR